MMRSVVPDKGNEKYIFVSYAHADRARIAPIVERLSKAGFNLSHDFDETFTGSVFDQVKERICGCSLFLLFISEKSLQSKFCNAETELALKEKKAVLSIFLDDVQLDIGMDMMLSRYASMNFYQFPSLDTFCDKLMSFDVLRECKNEKRAEKKSKSKMKCAFEPYEGNEKYIFISYAHADGGRVAPILEKLNEAGFRVWYDEGIEWGTEWPEEIASHIRNCCVCMPFHSKASAASQNCRNEINYALKRKKSILSVYLEEVELSDGMDMQLSSFQSTFPYQYDDMSAFYERLVRTEVIRECRTKSCDTIADAMSEPVSTQPRYIRENENSQHYDFGNVDDKKIMESAKSGKHLLKAEGTPNDEADAERMALYTKLCSLLNARAAAAAAASPIQQQADVERAPVYSRTGKCGANLTWGYEGDTKTLYIEGRGEMRTWLFSIPWSLVDKEMERVVIRNGVTTIGTDAFYNCKSLKTVVLPQTLKRIEKSAFGSCAALESVNLPYGLKAIEKDAFYNCEALAKIEIPETVTSIGKEAFWGCSSLESLEIPTSITKIEPWTFWGCSSIERIVLPDTVTQISRSSFTECSSLRSIDFQGSRAHWIALRINPESINFATVTFAK